jgi:NADPH-dependent 2,4-dienoyl-CoA reductase/sulfur reductase-like enzyme
MAMMRRRSFLQLSAGCAGATLARAVRARTASARAKAKVVIVGGGFAGASCALTLRQLDPGLHVTLVDPDERYVTCPMSNSALVGLRDLKSLYVSRRGRADGGVRYVQSQVTAIDTERRRAHLAGGGVLGFDRLVLAHGIRFLWNKPQGYDAAASRSMPHAWQAGAQTEILAAQLSAMRDGGVVAISVPTGPMRCPPGPFERAGLIAGYLKQNKPRSKVLIFDGNNAFPKQDAFNDAWHALYPGMIEWIPVVADGAVVRVDPAAKILFTANAQHRVDVANIIPPQAPGLLAQQTGLASDHGWCPVKAESFESSLIAGVHVIGDACIADPMPKAASAANAQARQCARAIVAALDGREAPAAEYSSVCYSMLARGRALSIHGEYRVADGVIRQVSAAHDAPPVTAEQEALNAEEWYRRIVRDSFGA